MLKNVLRNDRNVVRPIVPDAAEPATLPLDERLEIAESIGGDTTVARRGSVAPVAPESPEPGPDQLSILLEPQASIIPALPARPTTVNVTATIYISRSATYTVAAETSLLAVNVRPFAMFTANEHDATLVNRGTIWHDPDSQQGQTTFTLFSAGAIENHGTIVSLVNNFIGYAYYSTQDSEVSSGGNSGRLHNTGQIFSIATNGNARILNTASSNMVVFNSGLLAASAPEGVARVIWSTNGGQVTNAAGGVILAEGYQAFAIDTQRTFNLVNAGRIEARSLDPVNSPSVAIHGAHLSHETFRVENSGIIRGDWAILMYDAFSPTQVSSETIINRSGGLIEGAISLDRGNDVVENAGTIRGWLLMGEGNDRVDNTGGRIEGVADLGWGNDEYTGGDHDDLVAGDNGDDILRGGGGNDLLLGGSNNDTLIGGAGNDGLFGEWGNDRIVTEGGDFVGGGSGNDRIELGDYTFEYASGDDGFDTLVLPTDTRIFDLSSALSEGALNSFEVIELGGAKSLVVRGGDVPLLTGGTELRIDGIASDNLYLVGAWSLAGTETIAGSSYRKYQLGGETVFISAAAAVTISATAPAGARGLDPVSGTPAPLPSPETIDFTSPITHLENYELTAPLTVVNAEELWIGFGLQVIQANTSGVNLDNYGTIASTSDNDPFAQTAALRNMVALNNYGAILAISNYATGSPRGAGEEFAGFVNALVMGGTVTNYGTIGAATVTGWAIGSTNNQNLINRGEIYAISVNGFATAVDAPDRFINYGDVYAQGGYSAIGVSASMASFENHGTIEADTTLANALQSVGLRMGQFGGPTVTSEFLNTGRITADIAVQGHNGIAPIVITNRGVLDGKVVLGGGNDRIVNNGTITGAVEMGGGNDVYDGTGGTQVSVDGGDGDDQLTGGNGAEIFIGGAGADRIDGGGGADRFVYRLASDSTAAAMDHLRNFEHGVDRIDLTLVSPVSISFAEHVNAAAGEHWTDVTIVNTAGKTLVIRVDGRATLADFIFPPFASEGDDVLTGTNDVDEIRGLGGNDVIDGLLGADRLYGDGGDDRFAFSVVFNGNATAVGLLDGGAGIDTVDLRNVSQTSFGSIEVSPGVFAFAIDVGRQRFELRDIERILFGDESNSIVLRAGMTAAIELRGGGGNDSFNVHSRAAAYGEEGDDSFYLSGTFTGPALNGVVDGGAGYDILRLGQGFTVDLVAGTATAGVSSYVVAGFEQVHITAQNGQAATVRGSEDNDKIFVTSDMSTGAILDGRGGDDLLAGGYGNDTITGGAGADIMDGGDGADRFIYNSATESTATSMDYLRNFQHGRDLVDLSAVAPRTFQFVEHLNPAAGEYWTTVTITTGSGVTMVIRIDGHATMADFIAPPPATEGDDVLTGTNGVDEIRALGGNDVIDGLLGADQLYGDDGDDRFVFSVVQTGAAPDLGLIDGGAGEDTIDVRNVGPVTLGRLETAPGAFASTLSVGTQRFVVRDVERIQYGDGDDIIALAAGFTTLVDAGGGNDLVLASAGNDRVTGAGGIDTLSYANASAGVRVDLSLTTQQDTLGSGLDTITGFENLTGSAFGDTLTANSATNVLNGLAGNDQLVSAAGAGGDRMDGGAGFDEAVGVDWSDLAASVGIMLDLNDPAGVTLFAGTAAERYLQGIESLSQFTSGAGDDVIVTGRGALAAWGNSIYTQGGNDLVTVYSGTTLANSNLNQIHMGDGFDRLIVDYSALTGAAVAYGGAGRLTIGGVGSLLYSGVEAMTILTGGGNDVILSLYVDDIVSTGAGVDYISRASVGVGRARIDGGAGVDTAHGINWSDLTAGVTLNLNNATGVTLFGGTATERYLRGIEQLLETQFGSGNDDIFLGSGALAALDNSISTNGGNDSVRVYSGAAASASGNNIVNLGAGGQDRLVVDYSALTSEIVTMSVTMNGADASGTVSIGGNVRLTFSGAETIAITGGGGNDTLRGGAGADMLDGGLGADTLQGGAGNDIYIVDNLGDVVIELAGEGYDEVRTSVSNYVLPANIEKLVYTGTGGVILGNAGHNNLTGGSGADLFRLEHGGADAAYGGGGDDGFYFGGAMDGADIVDGGTGNDQLALQGVYAGLTFNALGLTNVEMVVLLAGNDTRFANLGGALMSYNLTTRDANVAAGQMLTFQANTLRAGENFTLNASAETDGSILTFGGAGTENITGGQSDDGFYFGTGLFGANDRVDGQGGSDQLGLQGDYAGANALTFGANQLTSVEFIVVLSAADPRFGGATAGQNFSYTLTMNDGNVAAGEQMVISATTLRAAEVLRFNGSAETDGSFRVFGGAASDLIIGGQLADELWGGGGGDRIEGRGGADVLRGGAGGDIFVYRAISDSTAGARDRIMDFASGDLIDLGALDSNANVAGLQAFQLIDSGAAFTAAGQLRISQTGTIALVEGDSDGDGVADFAIEVTVAAGLTLSRANFLGLAPAAAESLKPDPSEMDEAWLWHGQPNRVHELYPSPSVDFIL